MKKDLFFISLALLLQACATVDIASNKDAGYTKKPKKIYIEEKCDKDGNAFCTALANGLINNFSKRDIASTFYIIDDLSLESNESINKRIMDYDPEAVLLVQQTVTGGMNTYELTLIDVSTKKHVWKSEISTSTGSYGDEDDLAGKGIKAVIGKLEADGIL